MTRPNPFRGEILLHLCLDQVVGGEPGAVQLKVLLQLLAMHISGQDTALDARCHILTALVSAIPDEPLEELYLLRDLLLPPSPKLEGKDLREHALVTIVTLRFMFAVEKSPNL